MSDAIVVGGGFFGCCLALRLARSGLSVTIAEAGDDILTRASAVNQARIHTGFHYPRSFVTAARSYGNYTRFVEDFRPAVRDDFTMLYAIASEGSKVSARRFLSMFSSLGAPISRAPDRHRRLFSERRVEDVFVCEEFAFDYVTLRSILRGRLEESGVKTMLGTAAKRFLSSPSGVTVELGSGSGISAPLVLNTTYGRMNGLLAASGEAPLPLKFEIAEIALCTPPHEMERIGVTVMDGPFFSAMPYPSRGLHSLTHVRHTPRASWTDREGGIDPDAILAGARGDSAAPLMRRDAARYMPCMEEARLAGSLMEVKVVLARNEGDDGRPILFHSHPGIPGLHSILGGKLDNIYDLDHPLSEVVPGSGTAAGRA